MGCIICLSIPEPQRAWSSHVDEILVQDYCVDVDVCKARCCTAHYTAQFVARWEKRSLWTEEYYIKKIASIQWFYRLQHALSTQFCWTRIGQQPWKKLGHRHLWSRLILRAFAEKENNRQEKKKLRTKIIYYIAVLAVCMERRECRRSQDSFSPGCWHPSRSARRLLFRRLLSQEQQREQGTLLAAFWKKCDIDKLG